MKLTKSGHVHGCNVTTPRKGRSRAFQNLRGTLSVADYDRVTSLSNFLREEIEEVIDAERDAVEQYRK